MMPEKEKDKDRPHQPPKMDEDPEAYTLAYVDDAVARYKKDGLEATIAHYNDQASVKGQWYLFLADRHDIILAHAVQPEQIGKDLGTIVAPDGYELGAELVMATEEGRWVEYLWHNPETNKLALKRSWAIRYDGYLFGSGHYEPWHPNPATLPTVSKDDPAAYTVSLVQRAIAHHEFDGPEATAAHYNDPAHIDGQWYVFITDEKDIFTAHAPRPDFLGTDIKNIEGLDGGPLGTEIAAATGAGRWIEYLWPNPETGETEIKRTWAIRHDGYLFGSGYYKPAPPDTVEGMVIEPSN